MTGAFTRRAVLGSAVLGGAVLGGGASLAGLRPARARKVARIVSMDYALTETLLALGVAPVGMPEAPGWARWVVEPPLPASVQDLGNATEVNLELLASLKPDLILTTPYLDALAPVLARIAPCERLAIAEPGGAGPLERAEGVTRRLAALLGRPARGEACLAEAAAQFEADRARLAALPRAPLLVVNVIDARHLRVYGAKSLWQDVLDRLDRPNAWDRPTLYWGFATVGVEELATVPADTVLVSFRPIPPDAMRTLAGSRLWRALPFARAGRILELDPALVFGAVPSARRFSRLLTAALAGMAS